MAASVFSQTGVLEVTLRAKNGTPNVGYLEKDFGVIVYNTSWQQVTYRAAATGALVESIMARFPDLAAGRYYVSGGFSYSTSPSPVANQYRGAWRPEYYDNAHNQPEAQTVEVISSDTTRITIDLAWTSFIYASTSPVPFSLTADGASFPSPQLFSWRQGETHTVGVDEYADVPGEDPVRFFFKEWSNGGSRVQNYTVPAPLFCRNADSPVAYFDNYKTIVIATNPRSLPLSVDGAPYDAPHMFRWKPSGSHSIGVDDSIEVSGDPTRYVFREWRHGGDRVQNYTVPAPAAGHVTDSLVARFDRYSKLELRSRYGHPLGAGWHKTWTEVSFSVEDSVIEFSDSTFQFLKASNPVEKDSVLHLFGGWEGIEGYGSYSGRDNPAKFTIYGKTIEKALWKDQVPLMVSSGDTSMGAVSATPPGLWQDKDSTVALQAVPKPGYRFIHWEGSVSDTASLVKVTMDTSKKITAVFEKTTGVLEVTLTAKNGALPWNDPPGPFFEKDFSVVVYNTSWEQVAYKAASTGTLLTSILAGFSDLPAGHYYVHGSFSYATTSSPVADQYRKAWRPEYHDSAYGQADARTVEVKSTDTTRISIDLQWTSFISVDTNPKPFPLSVDGAPVTAPKLFAWRQSETHAVGADDTVDVPGADTLRFIFREWNNGGTRVQNYTVPPPLFCRTADSLVAYYDSCASLGVESRFGHPLGAGWHKTGTEVSFSVEDSVIEYSDASFQFLKASDPVEKDSVLHLFDRWEGAGVHGSYTGKDNPAKLTLYGKTVEKARWKDRFPLVVSSGDTSCGTVSVTPPGRWHDRDSTASLHAVPKTGCRFIRWQGSVCDTASLIEVTMDTSKKITAVFERLGGIAERPVPLPSHEEPGTFMLFHNYPNPFNPGTEIRFDVPFTGRVRIEVYSLIGKRLAVLADGEYGPGAYLVRWNGTDDSGRPMGSGIYFCRMAAGNFTRINKMQLIR